MSDILDRAVAAWREQSQRDSAGEALSAGARRRIAEAAWTEGREFRPLFVPSRWIRWATAVPAVAVTVATLGVLVDRPGHQAQFVGAEKNGDEVVFEIADGRGPHTVVKSTDPARFNPAASATTQDGQYSDRVNTGPVLVFYKLD
jgi:hypothetical protein